LRGGNQSTAQAHPRVQFRRAIASSNAVSAEATAREIGLNLEEALQLVLLYAACEPTKRAALRWFRLTDLARGVDFAGSPGTRSAASRQANPGG